VKDAAAIGARLFFLERLIPGTCLPSTFPLLREPELSPRKVIFVVVGATTVLAPSLAATLRGTMEIVERLLGATHPANLHVVNIGIESDDDSRQTTDGPLRGKPREPLHVAGEATSLDPGRTYLVAATDYELEPYGRLVGDDWELSIRYDFPTIIREAIEKRLATRLP
jgi:hypothetical protein